MRCIRQSAQKLTLPPPGAAPCRANLGPAKELYKWPQPKMTVIAQSKTIAPLVEYGGGKRKKTNRYPKSEP